MSGIAGIFHIETAKPVDEARLRMMLAPMHHRGPAGAGLWSAPGVGLGHIRLTGPACQPTVTAQGDLAVICDGAIQNVASLRADLAARGHRFRDDDLGAFRGHSDGAARAHGDGEVLLHGWRQWGEQLVERLEGPFALALFDARAQALWLARDRVGLKPLHHAMLADGSLIFASELKGLLAHPGLRRTAEVTAVADYLACGYVPDDTCLVRGVRKLGAGEALLAVRGRPLPPARRYWDISFADRTRLRGAALEEALRERLRGAVRAAMAGDAPAGALLSGAVESQAVTALMAQASHAPVTGCTIDLTGAPPAAGDPAGRIARRLGVDHHRALLSVDDLALIDRIAAQADEPLADAAALPFLRLCDLTRETMAVALCGAGADEGFAGAARHLTWRRDAAWRGWLPGAIRTALHGTLARLSPGGAGPANLMQDGAEACAAAAMVTTPALRAQLWRDEARGALNGYRPEDRMIAALRAAPARNWLDRIQYADIRLALPAAGLARMDRMSMAAGLDVRAPLLDHHLLEFAARLPVRRRIHGRSGKYLLRKAMEPLLPLDTLYRPERGFVLPLDDWFRTVLARQARALAEGSALARCGWFDMRRIARIVEAHRTGAAGHGRLLWQLMMLDRALGRLFGLS